MIEKLIFNLYRYITSIKKDKIKNIDYFSLVISYFYVLPLLIMVILCFTHIIFYILSFITIISIIEISLMFRFAKYREEYNNLEINRYKKIINDLNNKYKKLQEKLNTINKLPYLDASEIPPIPKVKKSRKKIYKDD